MTTLQGPCSRRTRRKGEDECPRLEGIKVTGMMLGMWAHGMNCVWGQRDWSSRGVQNLAPVSMGTVCACPGCCSTNGWENRRTEPSWPKGALGKCGSRIWKEQHRPTKGKPACNFSPKPLRALPGRGIYRVKRFKFPVASSSCPETAVKTHGWFKTPRHFSFDRCTQTDKDKFGYQLHYPHH